MASAIDGNKLASRPRLGKFESGDGRPLQVAHALNEYPGNTGEVSGVAQERVSTDGDEDGELERPGPDRIQ